MACLTLVYRAFVPDIRLLEKLIRRHVVFAFRRYRLILCGWAKVAHLRHIVVNGRHVLGLFNDRVEPKV